MAITRIPIHPHSYDYATAGHTSIPVSGGTPRPALSFDPTNDEYAVFTTIAPQGLVGTLSAVLTLMGNAAGTAATYWDVAVEAVTHGESNSENLLSADSFATTNTGNVAMPTTQGKIVSLSITLTNADSIVAGDYVRIRVNRDANHASDQFAADAYLLGLELREA